MTDMDRPGSAADGGDHGTAGTGGQPGGSAFEQFLSEARRRRAQVTDDQAGRPQDWVDPDPDALARLADGQHPVDRAVNRRKAGKSHHTLVSLIRRATARLHDLDPSKPADPRRYPWHHLDADTAAEYRKSIYSTFSKQSTRNDYVVAVRAVVRQCYKIRLISATRRDELLETLYTITPGPSGRRRRLTADEIAALLRAAATVGRPAARARNVAIIALFVTSGIRVGELVKIELADWDRRSDVVRLRDTKNGRDHDVFLHPEVVPLLRAWVKDRGDAPGALFTRATPVQIRAIGTFSVLYMVQTRAAAAGLEPFGCHDFRRTFATTLLRSNDPALVSKLLNHVKLSSTLIYDLTSEEEQRDAVASIELPDVDALEPRRDEQGDGEAA